MTFAPYYYGESKLNDDEDDHHIDRVEVEEEDEEDDDAKMKKMQWFKNTMERVYEHEVSYWKAWKAKQKILEQLFGTHKESFQNLPRMLQAIRD